MDDLPFDSLTATERKVLRLVDHHHKTEVIAAALGLSPHTINQHVAAARRKLGGISRFEAAERLRAHEAHPRSLGSMPLGIDAPVAVPPETPLPSHLPAGITAVHDRPSPMNFADWGGDPPRHGAPSNGPQLTTNLVMIGKGAFRIVVYLLCIMAVADMLERLVRSNAHLFPL